LAAVGLGSLYLVTDVPVLISGQHAAVFDPQGVLGSALFVEPGWHGRVMDLDPPTGPTGASPAYDVLNTLAGLFDLGKNHYPPGTYMRLPLRTRLEGQTSRLSDTEAANPGYVTAVLSCMHAVAEPTLCFARTLEAIRWSETRVPLFEPSAAVAAVADNDDGRDRGGSSSSSNGSEASPVEVVVGVYSAVLANATASLRRQRAAPHRIPPFVGHRGPSFYKTRLTVVSTFQPKN
jgi:hypothetical protein